MTPKTSEQTLTLSTITGLLAGSPDRQDTSSPKVSFQTSVLPGRHHHVHLFNNAHSMFLACAIVFLPLKTAKLTNSLHFYKSKYLE